MRIWWVMMVQWPWTFIQFIWASGDDVPGELTAEGIVSAEYGVHMCD